MLTGLTNMCLYFTIIVSLPQQIPFLLLETFYLRSFKNKALKQKLPE